MAREHIRVFLDVPGVEVTGIHSRTRHKAEAIASDFGIAGVYESVSELWERTQASLVVVAVSVASARDACLKVFEHPWTCLVEKPAGYDVADAERIAAVAERSAQGVFVALNRRHFSSTRTVVENLSAIKGERLIHVYDQEDLDAARQAGHPEIVVQNWMYGNSIHCIDYFRVLGRGDIDAVEPIIHWDSDTPRFVAARLAFSSGDIGLYEAVWNGPGPWAVTVTTQEKRWEMRPLESAAFQPYGSRKLQPVEVHAWDILFKPGLRYQAGEAVKAARGESHSLPSLEEALATMRLVQRLYA